MKLIYFPLLFSISVIEVSAIIRTHNQLLAESNLNRLEFPQTGSGFIKFQNDTHNSDKLISGQNKGYKFNEVVPSKTNHYSTKHTDTIFYQNHYNPSEQLHFSNHMRDFANYQDKFQNGNRIDGDKINFSNHGIRNNKDEVKFQDQNSINAPSLDNDQFTFHDDRRNEGSKINFFNDVIRESNYDKVTFQDDDKVKEHKIYFSNNELNNDINNDSNLLNNGIKGNKEGNLSVSDDNRFGNQHYQDNFQNNGNVIKKKKRRKPRLQHNYSSIPYPGNGYPYGQIYPQQTFPPSTATDAISTVTNALTNIARYDDYQCVSYLLCDAASGGTLPSLGSHQSIQMLGKLQPILHLLAAYHGLTFSPMYVFGRAVFIGATSKEDPSACRQAYPLCPSDPEKLVHYLNNHNGGFFRFFNTPANTQSHHNLEEFYNQLQVLGPSQQNYGLYQPPHNPHLYSSQFQYGLQTPDSLGPQQNSGLYQFLNYPQSYSPQFAQSPEFSQNYGLYPLNHNAQTAIPHYTYGYQHPSDHRLQYNPQRYSSQYEYGQQFTQNYGLYKNPYAFHTKPSQSTSSNSLQYVTG